MKGETSRRMLVQLLPLSETCEHSFSPAQVALLRGARPHARAVVVLLRPRRAEERRRAEAEFHRLYCAKRNTKWIDTPIDTYS